MNDLPDYLFKDLSDDINFGSVCVEHKKFNPCRKCLYGTPALIPYSDKPEDVAMVREYQNG